MPRVEEETEQETNLKQVASIAQLHAGFFLGFFLVPEDGGNKILRNVG
jgi:hypothetical protein